MITPDRDPAQALDAIFEQIISDLSLDSIDADTIETISVGKMPDVHDLPLCLDHL
jgi:hypothetical protein